ncbi:peptidase inhibitor family I36 protein [Nonomuraea sp. NPDC004580]|uniref:peptidase inhibitor family I36 protein n=1 Tax=Nonomuraea sp. NPDC004580 TaxID=3154552 RepID=UPI0033B873CF
MKRQIMRTAGVAALVLTGVLGISPSAQADRYACKYSLCVYEHDNFKGDMWAFTISGRECQTMGRLSDRVSSMRNNVSRVRFYNASNCAGSYGYTAQGWSEDADLTNNGFDNKASSMKPG